MNKKVRIELVRAMDTVCSCINDEMIQENWLMGGVADGDICENTTDEDIEGYIDDDSLIQLMDCFLRTISKAKRSGGLYIDGIVSNEG